ncbi:hypothetical protein MMC31_007593, partial [Peltigera leucophlebia]|nr:hypothetical protein [Peltigera leucophlebia]
MFGVLKPSLSKRPAATSPLRTLKRGRPARQPPSPSQQRRSSQSALSSELPSLDVPPDRRPVREIRPLSSKDAQPDRHPVREVRPARRSSVRHPVREIRPARRSSVRAINARN